MKPWANPYRRALILSALTAVFCASLGHAQSYGDGDQVLAIGAVEMPQTGDNWINVDGYLYDSSFDGSPPFVVALHLPDGAEVRRLCAYTNDLEAVGATKISVIAVKLVPGGGGDPYVLAIPDLVVQTTPGASYASYCTPETSYTVRNSVDVDGDQVPDNVAHYMKVSLNHRAGVGAVRVTWRRQVSPPPDTPTFGDVPASDGAFAQIEALASSGITAGCGGANFCPNAALTRRQMAVYLAKALGLHWTD
jgi:hypothetical protein